MLAERRRLPKGTRIRCTAVFDNSADNPNNPDPSAVVHWGEQTWEEMMIGAVTFMPAEQNLQLGVGPAVVWRDLRPRRWTLGGAAVVGASLAAWAAWRLLRRRRVAELA